MTLFVRSVVRSVVRRDRSERIRNEIFRSEPNVSELCEKWTVWFVRNDLIGYETL